MLLSRGREVSCLSCHGMQDIGIQVREQRFDGSPGCTAFPTEIPDDIGTYQYHDHRFPFPGDKGILFEKKEGLPEPPPVEQKWIKRYKDIFHPAERIFSNPKNADKKDIPYTPSGDFGIPQMQAEVIDFPEIFAHFREFRDVESDPVEKGIGFHALADWSEERTESVQVKVTPCLYREML